MTTWNYGPLTACTGHISFVSARHWIIAYSEIWKCMFWNLQRFNLWNTLRKNHTNVIFNRLKTHRNFIFFYLTKVFHSGFDYFSVWPAVWNYDVKGNSKCIKIVAQKRSDKPTKGRNIKKKISWIYEDHNATEKRIKVRNMPLQGQHRVQVIIDNLPVTLLIMIFK